MSARLVMNQIRVEQQQRQQVEERANLLGPLHLY